MAQRTDGTSWPASPQGPDSTQRHPLLPSEGWYSDPSGHAALRRWTGQAWSEWISDGVTVRWDAEGLRRRLGLADVPHLDFIERVFLPEARTRGCVTAEEEAVLDDLLLSLRKDAVAGEPDLHTASRAAGIRTSAPRPAPAARTPSAEPAAGRTTPIPTLHGGPGRPPAGTPASAWTGQAMPAPQPHPVAPPAEPSALSRWWSRTREAVGSDLAVHGLAYVGVLLFFVGAFGLVVFAFGDVAPTLRPLAELVIALVPFGAAALLLRRGATVVGRALEVMGGLLLPVMVVTSFLDDVGIPPDLEGVPMVVALTALMTTIAVSYAVWSRWHPDTALRYLVAPVAWLAVGMATLGLGRPIPDGKGVATPGAAQAAAMTAALVGTVVWARLRPRHRLSAPTTAVAMPGLAVIACLSLLSWAGEGWPVVPVLVSGILVLAALELLADRMPPIVVGLLETSWWTVASVALAQGVSGTPASAGAVAAVSAAGFLVVLETAAAARRPALTLALPAVGLAAALLVTTADPWWAVGAFAAAFLWAAVRRTHPFDVKGAGLLLDIATALFPMALLIDLARAADGAGALLAGGVLAVVALIPARWGLLARRPRDRYWASWWTGATVLVGLLTVAALAVSTPPEFGARWMLVATLALLTASSTLAPMSSLWRPPVVTALASLTWVAVAGELDLPAMLAVAPLAVIGLEEVVVAHIPGLRSGVATSLGLTGHAVGVLAVLMAPEWGWTPVVAISLATAGWWVTGWLDGLARSPVGASLTRVHTVLGWVPPVLAAAGTPLTVALTLELSGVLSPDAPWAVLVPALTALVYAGATRAPVPERVVRVTAWTGFLSALLAATWGGTAMTAAVGLASVPATVLLLREDRRRGVMTWTAWIVLAPLAGVLASELSPWFESLREEAAVALTLVAVGTVLWVGASAADLRGRTWMPVARPAHTSALAPAVVGGAQVLLGLFVAATLPPDDLSGWLFAAAAAASLVVAVLSRAGALTGLAVVLGWCAALLLGLPDLHAVAPWVALGTALALLLAAQALSRLSDGADWWARWDLPLLVAAVPVGATALGLAVGEAAWTVAAVYTVAGAECLGVAVRLRRLAPVAALVATTGAWLVLVGAGIAGPGWLALALLGLSAGLTALAVVARGGIRTMFQAGGAAAAVVAGAVAGIWLELTAQRSVELAALLAATVTLLAAGTVLWTLVDRSWARVWGGAAVIVEAVCAWAVLVPSGLPTELEGTWPVALGLVLVAGALAGSAGRLELSWLGDLSAGFGLTGLMVGLAAAGSTESTRVVVLSLVAAAGAAGTLQVFRVQAVHGWRRPVVELGAATALLALILAVTASDAMLLVPALLAAAAQAAATGVAMDLALMQMLAPVLAFGAWLAFSREALDGNPQWVTVPFGLTILAVVGLWRRDRRQSGRPVGSAEIVVLELVGVAFLVGSALVQTVTESVAYSALAAAIGLALAAWGVVSRVRRRVAAGLAVVLVAVVLLIGVPLVQLLPSWEGAGLWVLLGGLGLLLLLVAATIERSTAAARRGLARFAEATSGWE